MTRQRGIRHKAKAWVAPAPPCCCFDECCTDPSCTGSDGAEATPPPPVAEDAVLPPMRSYASAADARYAAMLRWCCLCCMCLCALCGWVPNCDTPLLGAEAAVLAGSFGGAQARAAHLVAEAAMTNFNVKFDKNNNNKMDSSEGGDARLMMPLAAKELLASVPRALPVDSSEPGDDVAFPADAAHSVSYSAGAPVPAASSASNDAIDDSNDAAVAQVEDFDVDEFLAHYHITSKAQLHNTLLAVEKRASAASSLLTVHERVSPRVHMARRRVANRANLHAIRTMGGGHGPEIGEDGEVECGHHDEEEISEADAQLLADGKHALVPIVFFVTLGTSALPWVMSRLDRAIEYIAFGACLSAGVILGAAFSHLLPDAAGSWATYFCGQTGVTATYPWAELIVVGTLLLLILIDSALIKGGIEGDSAHGHGHGHGHGAHGHSHAIPSLPADYDPTGSKNRLRLEAAAANMAAAATTGPHGAAHRHPSDPPHVHHHHAHVHVRASNADTNGNVHLVIHAHEGAACADDAAMPASESISAEGSTIEQPSKPAVDMVVCPPCDAACPPCDDDCPPPLELPSSPIMASAVASSTGGRPEFATVGYQQSPNIQEIDCCSASHDVVVNATTDTIATSSASTSVSEAGETPEPTAVEKLRGSKRAIGQAWVFFFALAIHSIFDGLSIGSETSVGGFYALLFAVGGHKILDGFALGVPMYFAKFGRAHTVFSLVFCAAMTPLGILIGKAATDGVGEQQATLARAIIISMSAGSFIFISVVELLPAGLMDGKHLVSKMLVTAIGWGVMAMLAIWV